MDSGSEMAVPEDIRRIPRPVNTVVEGRPNKDGTMRYIVRERSGTVYSNGRSRPRNGGVVGYIIDGRFVGRSDIEPVGPDEVSMITWAVERLALDSSADIIEDLREVYSETDAEMLYAMAILRVRHPELRNSRMKRDYRESILSEIFPNLPMSKNSVSEFLQNVGSAGDRMQTFLRTRCSRQSAGALVAVDGMLLTDNSDVNNLSNLSRKTRVRGNRDISMLFAFNVQKLEPICFTVYPGNMIDSKVYADFIESNDLRDAILVGDKAFTANAARGRFDGGRDLHYLFPIRRNAEVIGKLHLHDFNTVLKTYRGVTYCVSTDPRTRIRYYAFRDAERAADDETAYLESKRKAGKGVDSETLAKMRSSWGTIIFQSDLDLPAESVYDMYMQRWTIEEMFRMYKHIEEFDDTRVQSDYSVIGEQFVNFLSTIITSRIMNVFLEKGLLEKCGYTEVMDVLRRGLKFRNEKGEWVFRAQTDKEKDMLRKLDLMPKLPPKRGPGRPRKVQSS